MTPTLDDSHRGVHGWATVSLTALFGLQLLRVLFPSFVGYLRDARGIDALDLAPLALGIFATSFLAGLLRRVTGPRLAVWATAGGVGLIRLVEQFSRSPGLDLVLSAAGVALFLLFIPQALAAARAKGRGGATRFGFAFLLGVAADTAIHVGARTLDLSWQPGAIPVVIVALLVLGSLAALRAGRSDVAPGAGGDASWRHSFPLIALGPWLFLQLLVYQNAARVSALTGWETPLPGGWSCWATRWAWSPRPGRRVPAREPVAPRWPAVCC